MAIEGVTGMRPMWQMGGTESPDANVRNRFTLSIGNAEDRRSLGGSSIGDRLEISESGRMASVQQVQQMQQMQKPPTPPDATEISGTIMSDLDADSDGTLSLEELGVMSDQLADADTDSDGLISAAELQSAIEANMAAPSQMPDASQISERMLSEMDADGDGSLSLQELGDLSDRLATADSNSDGLLSREELEAAISATLESQAEEGMQPMGPGGPPPMQGPPPPPPDAGAISDQLISELDADKDEALSTDELGDLGVEFETADTDGDGLISREELLSAISAKMEEMGGLANMGKSEPREMNMFKQMIGMGTQQSGNTSGTEDNISLITQLLSELGLSEEQTDSVLDIVKNAGINIAA